MIKFNLCFDKDKETKWLNEMANQGYAMTGFFAGFTTFEKCEPGEYSYQIDFGKVSQDYKDFMEDTGVEIVQKWGYWVYLRKKRSEGEFLLYTDVDSLIEHYSKIRMMFKIATIIELICLLVEVVAAINGSGAAFVFAFLIGAVVLVFLNQVVKLNEIIAELKERKGELVQRNGGRRISPFVISGFLLNSCALSLGSNPELEWAQTIVQIVAVVLMAIGLIQTMKSKNS